MILKPVTKKEAAKAPQSTGVYIFWRQNEPLYVGKSINLKARLLSHLENAKLDPKEELVLSKSERIETILIESEFKALIEEARLIQKLQPKYNRALKDDKSHLWIKISIKEKYPRIAMVRRPYRNIEYGISDIGKLNSDHRYSKFNAQNSVFFGPFPSTRVIERMLREIRRVFPYCSQNRVLKRPCFHSKIGLCDPCPSEIEKIKNETEKIKLQKTYKKNLKNIVKIFRGQTDPILKSLYSDVKRLSKEEKYEEALVLRNRIKRFEHFISLNSGIERETVESGIAGNSLENLYELLKPRIPKLQYLKRIECYDISSLSQKLGTASLAVMTDGHIDKSQYRKFRIRNLLLRSDFEMLTEIMRRRFAITKSISPLAAQRTPLERWPMPNLLVVDGGRPQARTILSALSGLNVKIPVIGIAKNPDRLVIPNLEYQMSNLNFNELKSNIQNPISNIQFVTLRPPLNHPGFNLIRLLRDESHRVSHKYHSLLRSREFLSRK